MAIPEQIADEALVVRCGHATVVVPEDWTADAAAKLALIFRHAINPAPKKRSLP
jgi:hypothetical protein